VVFTCDGQDYYNQEAHKTVYYTKLIRVQYLRFLPTGAYQEVLKAVTVVSTTCILPWSETCIDPESHDEVSISRFWRRTEQLGIEDLGY